ncbi:MAG: DNA gyrase modulator [Bryobacteraceae bacterium]
MPILISMDDSELLPRKRCREIFDAAQQAARRAGVTEIEIILSSTDDSLTRFANNAIHQNVSERVSSASIRTQFDGRTARVSTNRLHRDGIQAAVDGAIALTKAAARSDELLPFYEEGCDTAHSRFSQAGAACTPDERAAGVREAIAVVEAAGQNAAGIFATAQNVEALLNSGGVARYYFDTLTQFSITAMTEDSSGWAKATSGSITE